MVIDEYDGSLDVAFRRVDQCCAHMDMVMRGDRAISFPCFGLGESGRVRATATRDASIQMLVCRSDRPFPRLVAWLDAVVSGADDAAFRWCVKDAAGELHWLGSGPAGRLKVSWRDVNPFAYDVGLNQAQMTSAFRDALCRFVESDRHVARDFACPGPGEIAKREG